MGFSVDQRNPIVVRRTGAYGLLTEEYVTVKRIYMTLP